jgi:hypothetical protein
MIINGQHSVTASKELQRGGCGETRRKELKTWDAVVVWTLDSTKLTMISQYYNITNHLNHAQPTWANQIFSCRRIWLDCKRPTNVASDAYRRKNGAVLSPSNFEVRNVQQFF